jgi:hypothetical protein
MFSVRDMAYVTALALVGILWYADRSLLAQRLSNCQNARRAEEQLNGDLEMTLIEAPRQRAD